jgi:hypothetical protein
MKKLIITSLIAASLALPAMSFSADLPPVKTTNGIDYISGGIGQPEIADMRKAVTKYDLSFTFNRHGGAFLANVNVVIKDNAGEDVFTESSSDPILGVALPTGFYTVTATTCDHPITKMVYVKSGRHEPLVFTWPKTCQ